MAWEWEDIKLKDKLKRPRRKTGFFYKVGPPSGIYTSWLEGLPELYIAYSNNRKIAKTILNQSGIEKNRSFAFFMVICTTFKVL